MQDLPGSVDAIDTEQSRARIAARVIGKPRLHHCFDHLMRVARMQAAIGLRQRIPDSFLMAPKRGRDVMFVEHDFRAPDTADRKTRHFPDLVSTRDGHDRALTDIGAARALTCADFKLGSVGVGVQRDTSTHASLNPILREIIG